MLTEVPLPKPWLLSLVALALSCNDSLRLVLVEAGGGIGLWLGDPGGGWVLALMCMAGLLGGMAYAAIPAFLKTRLGVNEILTSLMLTYVATLFLSMLVYGPWKDPEGFGFPQTKMLAFIGRTP